MAFIHVRAEEGRLPSPSGRIVSPQVTESSGLSKSSKITGLYWTHNDSGGKAELYPLTESGEVFGDAVEVDGAVNFDWEALCVDGEGRIWIGAFGNNFNRRQDLKIYQIREPEGELPVSVTVEKTLHFSFPDQKAFPPAEMNFDCEALFFYKGHLYVLTKHRSDTFSKLYRIEDLETEDKQMAIFLGQRDLGEMVTDAAMHPDGKYLMVLTPAGLWLFEAPAVGDHFLQEGGRRFLFEPWVLLQIEGITWIDDHHVLFSNEQRDLYTLDIRSEGWEGFDAFGVVDAQE
ncbi:hypothetical protein P3T73_16535 [Kiritimatiellota bacterium B12222]|nr:hypothetical protein P3T73_16535 [Kiritimatiellota bacterium B12222]